MNRSLIVLLSSVLVLIGLFAGIRMVQLGQPADQWADSQSHASRLSDADPDPESPLGPAVEFYDNQGLSPASGPSSASSSATSITAKAYLVGDVKTGKIYLKLNEAAPLPVASMSKLITAIVAADTISPTTTVRISMDAAAQPIDGSVLLAGERFSPADLMYPLLLSSSNAAAEALASSSSRHDFLAAMSSTAWRFGMKTAYFADPSGLDPHNLASSMDMFALAKYLYASRQDILSITRTVEKSFATTTDYAATTTFPAYLTASGTSTATSISYVLSGHGYHDAVSIHPFVKDPRFLGGKTGRTFQAGETMLTILDIDGHPIAFIVLGSAFGHRAADTKLLIERLKAISL